MTQISLSSIATSLGVSVAAVSLALGGKPGVSDELRKRILEYAKKNGYSPDPVAAELMAIVRARRRKPLSNTIAFINTFTDPSLMESIDTFRSFFQGAQRRAEQFGYRLEQFRIRAPGMSGPRLSKILLARGVRGVLIGPRWRVEPDIDLDWPKFSSVVVGEAEYGPKIHRVCNHHVHSCSTALEALAKRGYKRIGFVALAADEVLRGYDYLLGVHQFSKRPYPEVKIYPWIIEEWNEGSFLRWARRNKIDAVVSLSLFMSGSARKIILKNGEPAGFAHLDVPHGSPISGITQHSEEIGATAADLLRSLLHSGQRGETEVAKVLLIDGTWKDGISTRPLARP